MTQDEYAEMLSQAKEQFKQGTPLFGKDGAFHRVLEDFLNSALEEGVSKCPHPLFYAQSPDFLKPGLCYFLKFLYL